MFQIFEQSYTVDTGPYSGSDKISFEGNVVDLHTNSRDMAINGLVLPDPPDDVICQRSLRQPI